VPKAVTKLQRATSSNKQQKKILLEAKKILASIPDPPFPKGFYTFWNAARYVVQSLAVVALGGLVIGKLEGWSWIDSIYYSFITGKRAC
jgi:hypothetical protein